MPEILLGKVMTRLQFSKLFSSTWKQAITMENLVSGFRFCGVYPFNRNAQRLKLFGIEDWTEVLTSLLSSKANTGPPLHPKVLGR